MLIWSENMYIGKQLSEKGEKIKKKLNRKLFLPDVFLITRPTNEDNLFDIFQSKELLFPYHKRREIIVCGLAKDKEEALTLVTTMLEDMYRETGGLCSKEYFLKQ